MSDNVREGCDNLLLRREFGALLEFKVSDGTREGKIAIDSIEIDETAGSTNAGFLSCFKLLATSSGLSRHVFSPSFWGLWSNDKGFALPFTPKTDLESPALP